TPSTRSGPRWGRRRWPRPEQEGAMPRRPAPRGATQADWGLGASEARSRAKRGEHWTGPQMSKFARDSFGIFAAQIAVMALGIGTSVITARTLGPSGRGLFQLLTIFPATMSNFAKLGIPVANVYCIRRRGARVRDGGGDLGAPARAPLAAG